MAFDEGLAHRVREILDGSTDVTEKKMFGGLAFMVRGNMCCGIVGDELMVRVGPDRHAEALARPEAREMDFTGRPMKGMVYVGADGVDDDGDLASWIGLALEFNRTLPAK